MPTGNDGSRAGAGRPGCQDGRDESGDLVCRQGDDVRSSAETTAGYAWLAELPGELAAQRRVLSVLLEFCAATPLVTSLSVGCSLGRGAADALSDVDGALGVAAERGERGAGPVQAVEEAVAAALPQAGPLVDVLRHRTGPGDRFIRVIFAQFADGTQLDLAVVAEGEVRRGDAAPDFVSLYRAEAEAEPAANGSAEVAGEHPAADAVTGDQLREWAFEGWCALLDADKYLQRGSLWEAHNRLHQARHHIWALWAAAGGALYPWHGLSQVLDHDPGRLPPGIEATVAGLEPAELRRAARASAAVLAEVSTAAARSHPVELPDAMARYVTQRLSATSRGR
jgi:hypothetical protein